MSATIRCLAGCLGLLLLFAGELRAESPEEAVRNLVKQMKTSGNLTPLVEQVDWDTRFRDLSPEERSALGVGSAEEMKNHFYNRASANGEDVVEKLRQAKEEEAAAGITKGADPVRQVEKELEREQGEFQSRLAGTDYSIVRAEKKANDRYVVTVRKSYQDETEEVEMGMRLKGGRWLVDSAAPLNPAPAKQGGASPLGRLPEPVAVLGQP